MGNHGYYQQGCCPHKNPKLQGTHKVSTTSGEEMGEASMHKTFKSYHFCSLRRGDHSSGCLPRLWSFAC